MPRIARFLIVVFVSLVSHAQAVQTPIEGIMATGKQIAQVRFMLEIYSIIGAGIKYQTPKTKLQTALKEYEKTLDQLQQGVPDSSVIQEAVKKSRAAWPPVKKSLLTALNKRDTDAMKKEALFVHGNIRTLIKEMETMKNFFLKNADTPKVQEINDVIEIAASARRLSSHYMLKMWEVPDPTIEEHWKSGMEKYRKALMSLQKSSVTKDPEIVGWIKTCANELTFFQTVIAFDHYVPILVQRHAHKAYEAAGSIIKKMLSR